MRGGANISHFLRNIVSSNIVSPGLNNTQGLIENYEIKSIITSGLLILGVEFLPPRVSRSTLPLSLVIIILLYFFIATFSLF